MKNTVSFIWFWSGFWLAVLFYQTFRHGSFCLLIGCGFLRFVKVNFGQGEIHVSISKNWVYLHDHELPPCQLVAWGFYRPYCQLVAGRFSMVAIAPYYSGGHCTKLQLARCNSLKWQGVTLYSLKWQGVTLSDSTLFLLQNSFQSYENSKINAKIKGNPTRPSRWKQYVYCKQLKKWWGDFLVVVGLIRAFTYDH